MDDDYTKALVTPAGQTAWVQSGVQVKMPSLKAAMLKVADTSVYDLTPEECGHKLKKRLAHGRD